MEYVLPEERLGRLLGERYRLLHVLGEGGTSIVYEATDERTGARVAVKLLRPELAVDEEAARRFSQEAKLALAFHHPAAARVIDVGGDQRMSWIALELVDGPTLADHLRLEGPLEPDAAIDLLLPVVDAVASAHRRGAIHRDLKPSNVMLAELGERRYFPKLVDFGLARLDDGPSSTTRGRLLGTPHYMSPEQAAGTIELTKAVDVWALGVILYECVEGRRPFDGPSSTAVLMQVMRFDAPKLRRTPHDAPIARVIARALSRSPEERFTDAAALSSALLRARDGRLPIRPRFASLPTWTRPLVATLLVSSALAFGARALLDRRPAGVRGAPDAVATTEPAPPTVSPERTARVAPVVEPAQPPSAPVVPAPDTDPRPRRVRAVRTAESSPAPAPQPETPSLQARPGIAVTRTW